MKSCQEKKFMRKLMMSQVWGCMPVISTFRRQRSNKEFKVSLGSTARLSQKKKLHTIIT
jgi:hypothetical protein